MNKLFSKKLVLAPMAGFNDPAFRLLCLKHGADLAVTELISSDFVVSKAFHKDFLYKDKKERTGVQLFGNNPSKLGKASKIVQDDFDFVDFNMGCPSFNIIKQESGGYLLGNPLLAEKIFVSLRKNTDKPLTLKLRAGIKDESSFLNMGLLAEKHGFDMITLHPRTLIQGYSGKANWSLIKKLKESVNIPVTGNGDVNNPSMASKMFRETGCDNVMIGRYALTNPSIFEDSKKYLSKGNVNMNLNANVNNNCDLSDVDTLKHKLGLFKEYVSLVEKLRDKAVQTNFTSIKQHALMFTREIKHGSVMRTKITLTKTEQEILNILEKK